LFRGWLAGLRREWERGVGVGGTEFFFEVDDAVFAQLVGDGLGGPVGWPWGRFIACSRSLEGGVGFLG